MTFVLLFVTILIASVSAKATATPAKPIKIGLLMSLSGKHSGTGGAIKDGVEFVVDEILAAGGIKSLGGAPVRLIHADTASSPRTALSAMERLLTREKVSFVVGPYANAEWMQAGPLSDRYKVGHIGVRTVYMEPLIGLKLKYANSLGMRDVLDYGMTTGWALGQLVKEFGVKAERIAFMASDLSVFQLIMDGMRAKVKELGLWDRVVDDIKYEAAAPDLSPVASRLKAKNPDVILGPGYFGPAMVMFRAMDAVGFYPPIHIASDTTTGSAKAVKALGPELAKKMLMRPGQFFTAYFNDKAKLKSVQDFVAKATPWAKAHGYTVLEVDFVMGAQAMYLVWRALEEAGTRDPVKLNQAFRALKVPQGDPFFIVPSFSPAIEFDDIGNPVNARFMINQWNEAGGIEVIYPKELRSAEPRLPK